MQGKERRRAPRLQVLNRVRGQLVSAAVRLKIREMGRGGFSVESAVAFPPGARRLFRFTTHSGVQVIIEGAVAHSRQESPHSGDARHVTGFRFIHSRLTDTAADITLLLEATTGMPGFQDEFSGKTLNGQRWEAEQR